MMQMSYGLCDAIGFVNRVLICVEQRAKGIERGAEGNSRKPEGHESGSLAFPLLALSP